MLDNDAEGGYKEYQFLRYNSKTVGGDLYGYTGQYTGQAKPSAAAFAGL